MRIGLDFDGVLSDCGVLKSACLFEMFGVRVPPERCKKEFVVGGGILTMAQYHEMQDRIYGSREFGSQMTPVPGMLEVLPRLMDDGHDVKVITSRTEKMLDVAREWCATHGLDLAIQGIGKGRSKAEAARGLAVYVDDDLDKIVPLVGIVPHRFLFSWGYNAHENPGEVAERVSSWRDFGDRIGVLSRAAADAA